MQETIEKQELYCHECGKYVQFDVDMSLNGNHVLSCPNCGHEHCRVVKDGIITEDRWDSRNQTYVVPVYSTGWSNTSTWTTTTSGTSNNLYGSVNGTFLYSSWMNTLRA